MKKTWKRLCALFLAVVMTLSLLPTAAFAADGVSTQADGDLRIPGYTRVTEMTADIDDTSTRKGLEEGNYLIVAPYDGKYYMLYPGTTGAAGTNSARLEVDANGKATGYKPGYGSVYDSATLSTNWAAAENHIVARGGGRHWSHDTNTFDQWWEGYTVTATAGDKTYSLFKSGVCYSESTDGQTAINIDKNGTAYLRSGTGSTLGSYLVFYTPNMNFNQNSGKDTTTNIGDLMLFKRNAEVGSHIPALGKPVINGIGAASNWNFTPDSNGGYTVNADASIVANNANPNRDEVWQGTELNGLNSFLIRFDFLPQLTGTENCVFKVRMKNSADENNDWLQVAFSLTATSGTASIQVARQKALKAWDTTGDGNGIQWPTENPNSASVTWGVTAVPVDVLYDNGEVTVYWNGTAILCETVPQEQLEKLTTNKLAFAGMGPNHKFTITNLDVSTYPDPVDPPEPGTPDYTDANVNAGLFDVGANPTQNSSGVWSANYSNPSSGTGPTTEGTVVNATAPSYMHGTGTYPSDAYPYYAVDGSTSADHVWHTNYGGGTGTENAGTANGGADCYLQLEIVGDPVWLNALRYQPKNTNNAAMSSCRIEASMNGESWFTVKEGSWDTTLSSGSLTTQKFAFPVEAKYVRFYGTSGAAHMDAVEVRLVKAETQEPTVVSNTFTVKSSKIDDDTNENAVITGAVITIAGQTLTTDERGEAKVSNLLPGKTYTAQVAYADHESKTVTVTAEENGASEVTLTAINRTITGKVTIKGEEGGQAKPLEGATVTLVNTDAGFTTLANGPTATTDSDGNYTLDINTVAAGSYKVRASAAGYDAVIVETVVTVTNEAEQTYAGTNVALTAIEKDGKAKFSYDMSDGHQPTLGLSGAADQPTYRYTDDGLEMSFTSETRMNNLVKLTGTGVKNGIIEFDATRTVGNIRFGLALRLADSDHWIFVGQWNDQSKWAREYWYGAGASNSEYGAATGREGSINFGNNGVSGPSFGVGDTRHFKVTIDGNALKLEIDGIVVFDASDIEASGHALPSTAADVGFICGNSSSGIPSTITIDNLYIFREDGTKTVTLSNTGGATLEAKISTSAGDQELGLEDEDDSDSSRNQAAVGDVIKITCPTPGDGKALASVTVEETDGSGTVEATQTGDGVFTFTMPDYPVTVTGTLKSSFEAELSEKAPQENKPYQVTVTPSGATVTYVWEVEGTAGEGNFHTVTEAEATVDANTGAITPKNIAGKALRVTVTGTGDYTGIKTLTTAAVLPPDVLVNTVGLQRHGITMWTNDESKSSDGNDLEVGHEVTLIATTSPTTPSYVNLKWESANDKIAEVEKVTGEDSTQATLTAVGNGTTTVTVTACDKEGNELTDAENNPIKDEIEVTVKTRPTAVAVSTVVDSEKVDLTAEDADPLILWANADKDQSATLTAELTAAPVTVTGEDGKEETVDLTVSDDEKGLTWEITGKPENLEISVTPGENNTATVQVLNTGMDNVGEVTVIVTSTTNEEVTASFKVIVKRQIETDIRITGEAKHGEKLGWAFQNTVGGNADLTYQWYRLDAETFATIGLGEGDDKVTLESLLGETAEISGKTGDTTGADGVDVSYTLEQADIGNYIVVKVVPAEDNKYYEGTKIAVTDKPVEKEDAPAAPQLEGSQASEDSNDGKITIVNYNSAYTYQIKLKDAEWPTTESDDSCDVKTVKEEARPDENGGEDITVGVIENLAAGTYVVRVKATNIRKESAESEAKVAAYNETLYNIRVSNLQNGTIVRPANAAEGGEVTITVTPAAGYEFKDPEETETAPDKQAVTVSWVKKEATGTEEAEIEYLTLTLKSGAGDTESRQYTFEMPAGDVTISATFKVKKVTISHTLANLTCSLYDENDPTADKHEVDWGKVTSITLTPDEGYTWPESITIVHEDGEACNEFTYRRGIITFDEGALERDITITATAEKNVYAVQYTPLTNLTTASDLTAEHGEKYTGVLTSTDDDYKVPATITVTMGGKKLTLGATENGYTYTVDEAAGTGTIVISNVTGAVVITAAGERITVPVTKVKISIGHSDPGTAEAQKNVPHVGDTLTANVTPSNASVTYQWVYVNGDDSTTPIAGAGNMTYKVTQEDYENKKKIGVKVVGITAAGFSGESQDALEAVVGPQSIPTTGVTLNAFTHSMSVGQSFTLNATVQPDGATNKTVTWKVINDQNDEITDESIVKLTDNGDGTATVEGKGVGTVRVVATNAGGQTARCVVTVERANQYTLNYMVRNDTENDVTVEFTTGTSTEVNSGDKVVAGTQVTVTVSGVGEDNVANVTVTANNQTSNATEGSGNTWTFTMPGYETLAVVSITAKPVAVTGVTLSQDTATVGVGKSFGLNAHVEPGDAANQAVTWSSDDEDVATVTQQGLVTGVAEGTTNITVTTADGGKTATCEVTVAVDTTALNTAINTATNAKTGVVANDAASTAEVAAGTRYTTQANIDALDTAIVEARKVGKNATQDEVDAAVIALNAAVATFNSQVKIGTKIQTLGGSVTVAGTAKFEQQLAVNTDNVTPAAAKDSLHYQWQRNGVDISTVTGSTYTLVKDDINTIITVVVTSDDYPGSLTGSSATVEKKDGPTAPSARATKCTTSANNDGTITGLTSDKNYEICHKTSTDPDLVTWSAWEDADVTTEGKIIGLEPGVYQVREKVGDTTVQKEGTAATVEVFDYGTTVYEIEVDMTNGSYDGNGAVASGQTAIVILSANTGCVPPETITVTMDGTALTVGDDYTYTRNQGQGTGTVTIPNVTGKVVITAVAIPELTGTVIIRDAAKYNEELTADVSGVTPEAAQAGLTYQWVRTKGGVTTDLGTDSTYTLVKEDIGATIKVVVTAGAGYTGELSAETDEVAKADAPATPTLSQTKCTAVDNSDGKITITNYDSGATYEIRSQKNDGTWDDADWADATVTAEGVITKPAGTYQVRVKVDTEVQTLCTAAEIRVYEHDAVTFTVSITVNYGTYTGSATTTVASGTGYSTKVTAATDYVLPEIITVAKDDGTALAAGTGYTYDKDNGDITITDVTENVTITVTCEFVTPPMTGAVTIVIVTENGEEDENRPPKFGETLTANVTGAPTGATLHYQWQRTKNGTPEDIGTNSNKYTLIADDIGATITVVVTAEGYDGEKTASTSTVAVADGLPAPDGRLEGVAPTSATANDGKIKGLEANHDYEVSTTADGSAGWETKTTNDGGEIEGLTPDTTYYVREVQDNNHNDNHVKSAFVPPYGAVTYTIDRSGIIYGEVRNNSGNAATAGKQINLTVHPDLGYRFVKDSLKVTYQGENGETEVDLTYVPAGEKFTYNGEEQTHTEDIYYFMMPAADVKISAQFDRITYTVTFDRQDGTDVTTDTVDYGGKVSEPANPDRTDYTFGGWYTDAGCTTAYNFNAILTADITLYAKWTKNASVNPDPTPMVPVAPSNPGGDDTKTETKKNEDGTTTTIVTDKKTGTVTETTEKLDGTVETVETKKDGTVTATTEKPDGSTEAVETKPDGTVTETATDSEGGKVEKVTTPEKDVAITVTDKDGEVLAEVEIPAEIPEPETRFEDVPVDHWADKAIHNMAALEVVKGVGDNQFDMNSNMTRGALATVLSRMSNGKEGLKSSFADVASGEWYADGIAWAAKTGVVTGYSATEFGPKDPITREQLAVMLCRYARLLGMDTTADSAALGSFKDGSSTHSWAADSIAWCVENGILKGMGNETLAPTANATRAQVAVMLQRFIDLMK